MLVLSLLTGVFPDFVFLVVAHPPPHCWSERDRMRADGGMCSGTTAKLSLNGDYFQTLASNSLSLARSLSLSFFHPQPLQLCSLSPESVLGSLISHISTLGVFPGKRWSVLLPVLRCCAPPSPVRGRRHPPDTVSSDPMALWQKLILAVLIVVTVLATYMVYVNQNTPPDWFRGPLKEPTQVMQR